MDAKQYDDLQVVHNCWAIYTDSLGDKFAEFHRPQDWGNPHWMYRTYRFSAPNLAHTVIIHGWLLTHDDDQPNEHQHAALFAPFCGQILLPGHNEKECGRSYLLEDDFWSEAWGEMPPFLEDNEEEGL